jgi:membrane-associated protease RseP (regulator of RpoE activity)
MDQYQAPSYGDGTAPISGATVTRFRIGPIPVRIEFPFFLVTVLLGYNGHRSAMLLLGWTVAVFVSVMVHELGHAVVGRLFGSPTSIVLHGMGGLTFRNGGRYPSAREDILISLAGSATQIILLGIPAYMITHDSMLFITSYGWYVFFWDLMWVSLGWGIINLLPILPLDGGNIAITLLRRTRIDEPDRVVRLLSVGTALGLAVWLYNQVGWMSALWALFFAVWNAVPLTKKGL